MPRTLEEKRQANRDNNRRWRMTPEGRAHVRANTAKYLATDYGRAAHAARVMIGTWRRRGFAGYVRRSDVVELLNKPCAYCGGPGGSIDHIVPLARGGTNDRSNLASACIPCNSAKGAQ